MSSFKYMAILGRQPELGLVELESLLGADAVQPFGRQAALVNSELDVSRLGGTVKAGVVIYHGPAQRLQDFPIDLAALPRRKAKTPFGLSVYGGRVSPGELLSTGLTLKQQLKAGGSVRFVRPAQGTVLTAAELVHNRVLEDGFELMVVYAGAAMVVARTTGVQDIGWYSRRDYGRPARSAKVGMLPPKLAQVMVNTTKGKVVADPFCGTGVVVQEALLLGREAWGCDLEPQMVEAAAANLEWLGQQVPAPLPAFQISQSDARSATLPSDCSVVSEGYLGPNLSHSPAPAQLDKIRAGLRDLYKAALASWPRQLPSGAEITLCAPAWRVGKEWRELGLIDELGHLGYTRKSFLHVPEPVLYARDDQIVGRQILMLRKN
jgi:tRNA (guanine10-N2)-dimethyltransferase